MCNEERNGKELVQHVDYKEAAMQNTGRWGQEST